MSFQIEYLERLECDLRAAGARKLRPRFWRGGGLAPRVVIAAACVVLMSGSLALAFGGRVLTAIGGGGPAPGHVKSEFRQMTKPLFPLDGAPPLPKGYLPGAIVPGSEHEVATVRTTRGTTARLYAARTTHGDLCAAVVGRPFAGGGCWGASAARPPFAVLSSASSTERRNETTRTLWGRTSNAGAATLRVTYGDGTHHDIVLVDGWFMFEVPRAHSSRAEAPVRLDVLAAGGARLGTRADPFSLHRPKWHFTFPVPSSVRLLATARLPNDGGTVAIWSGRDAEGRDCFRHLRNGKTQMFPAWVCGTQVGRTGYPLYPTSTTQIQQRMAVEWDLGLRNDWRKPLGYGYAYATGWVGPQVTRLTVRNQDGSAADITLHDRYYLYVVPPANWPAGHRPSILEARDASGAVVYRQFLYPRQHCIYPGRDPICHIAMGTG